MILQELVRYYDRQRNLRDSDIAPPGWIRRPLDYILVLGSDGECLDLHSNFILKNGRSVSHNALLPSVGKQALKHTNSGKDANLLWDNASFVLGWGDRRSTKLASFMATIKTWLSHIDDEAIRAVLLFLNSLAEDNDRACTLVERFKVIDDFAKRDPVIAFRLLGDGPVCVHERESVRVAYAARSGEVSEGVVRGRCLITGAVDVPLAPNEFVIKGVWHAQSSGANIVSFNEAAFVSYGKQDRNGESAPIGNDSSIAYSVALNHLLASDRNRVQVGDTSTVFWADAPSQFDGDTVLADFFVESKDDPGRGVRAVQALYEALASGQLPVGERNVQFFVLGLAPNAARISVRFWMRAPLAELAPRIRDWFEDLAIDHALGESEFPMLVPLLAASCAPSKDRRNGDLQRNPSLVGDVIRGVLSGAPLPASWLNGLVERCRAEQARKREDGKPAANVSYYRAASIKAILNRSIRFQGSKEREFTVALDPDNTNVAYRLGRLFATYERVQSDAAGRELNRTIRDAYFGAAMGTPASVFPRLEVLNGHHLRSLRRDKPGLAVKRDKLLAEITWGLDAQIAYPRTMPLHEQGRFALGYYHQRQAFYTRKEEPATNNPALET
jgi:CRISPR-associated protein Csd1